MLVEQALDDVGRGLHLVAEFISTKKRTLSDKGSSFQNVLMQLLGSYLKQSFRVFCSINIKKVSMYFVVLTLALWGPWCASSFCLSQFGTLG